MKLSVIIPAYNESENIQITVSELLASIKNVSDISGYEIIIIDDHSTDNTFNKVKEIGENQIRCVRLSKRSGSHVAIKTGLELCSGEIALCISADGQDDHSILAAMVAEIKKGSNIVWGVRKSRNEPISKKVLSRIFYGILKRVVGQKHSKINLSNADFYLLDKNVLDAVNNCNERNTSVFGLLVWLGFNQSEIEYLRKERRFGKSKWNFASRIKLATDWMIGFSAVPLRLITFFGLFLAVIGFLYAAFIFILALKGYTTEGWAETIILILIIGGIQLVMIGVIGEYLWRNLEESRKRPNYFIQNDSKETN